MGSPDSSAVMKGSFSEPESPITYLYIVLSAEGM